MARPLEFDRERAVQKALQLFLTRGYEATSIEDLTNELGISRASLYNAFGDKRGLMLETIGCADRLVEEMRKSALGKKGAAKNVIRAFFMQVVDNYLHCGGAPGCVFLVLGAELASTDAEVQRRVNAYLDASRQLFREILLREENGGKWSAKEVESISASLLVTLTGILMLLRVKREATLLHAAVDEAVTILD